MGDVVGRHPRLRARRRVLERLRPASGAPHETSDSGTTSDDAGLNAAPETGAGKSCSQGCAGTARPGALCVVSADAQLVETSGAPVSGETLFICGLNLCAQPVKTDARGKAHFDMCANMVSPALKFLVMQSTSASASR